MDFYYISRDGIALDDLGHEIKNAQGQPLIVPPEERAFYDLAYRENEQPEEWE
jgi:hypothetical protein